MYIIRHKANNNAFIEQVVAPPRLSEWTDDISKAQPFEHKREADAAADYITKNAFNVEAIEHE